MLKLEGLKLTPEEKEAALHRKAARLLRIPEEDVLSVQVLRRSIDAREELHLVYTVATEVRQEKQVLRRCRDRRVSRYAPERYALPEVLSPPEVPPVVVGAGPGGLFAALVLARCGLRPILLERGQDTVTRQRDVETFWRTGVLDPESNVQFGEGGAGAFSDGKLNTGTKDLRHRWILEELVRCGAPESILTDAKPHVGTDMLHIALQNLRQELLSLGAQMRFGHRLEGLESREGVLTGLHVRTGEGTYRLPVRAVVLAPGHSARDTFRMLYEAGIPVEAKPFAVGVRIEHRQRDMDAAQYRQYAGHPCLPASTYKLSCHTAWSVLLLRLPRRTGGGGSLGAGACGDQRHEPLRPQRREHQRRTAGGRHTGGLRHGSPSGGGGVAAAVGGGGLPAGGRRISGPLPAGGGLSGPPPLHGAGSGAAQLSPRRHVV